MSDVIVIINSFIVICFIVYTILSIAHRIKYVVYK